MKGQWIGRYEGTNCGLAFLDLDDEGTHFRGHAFAFDDPDLPSTVAEVVTADTKSVQELEIGSLAAIRPRSTHLVTREQFALDHPELAFPAKLTLRLEMVDQGVSAKWATDLGTEGSALLEGCRSEQDSELNIVEGVKDWRDFREYALSLPHRHFIFRGQDVCKRLRTSFHRSRRRDLIRYIVEDVPEAVRALSSKTRHLFNITDPGQNAAFLNLLQHHGYPTPLLDWTYSPFVAAFFAYRHRRQRAADDANVRIFMFDRKAWMRDWQQIQSITFARPHFSLLEALSIENQRAIPQQALLSATNVADIESYIRSMEAKSGHTYLSAVDLPIAERRKVMEELSAMGITAGSLFPGLDGACEELRGRFFHPV
jgi:hypothetical protein